MIHFRAKYCINGICLLFFLLLCISPSSAAPPALSRGQLIYVPVYSIFSSVTGSNLSIFPSP